MLLYLVRLTRNFSSSCILRMQMVTWHPLNRISSDDKVANDESDVVLKIHPLRCIVDQRAVAFIRAFFNRVDDQDDNQQNMCQLLPSHLYAVPPPLFTTFRVRPLKLKVDYRPQKLDTTALRNGAVVELINLSPLDGMILTLKAVNIKNEVGFGTTMSLVVRRWVEDICSTQLHKFVTKSRAFEPISEVGGAATDIFVLPWEAFQNGESMTKAIKAGAKSFSKVTMYELFNTSSRIANFVGTNVSRVSTSANATAYHSNRTGGNLLPDRPLSAPRTVFDTGPHVLESLSRGLQEANYTIIIVPYREYHRSGTTGAVHSVIKGLPVAIAAPTSGAAEALSYALLGARNQIRPDMRKEDEVILRGLNRK
jgi:autophagy-related protein 2